jgi:hypothetical protein
MFGAYERQLAAITGSAEQAHKNVEELVAASKTMGDPIEEIMAATKQLELFGLYSAKNLEILDDAADAMGKNLTEVVNVIAMASEGNIRGLRRYGINAIDLQREMGHKLKVDTIADLEDIGQAVLSIFEKSYKGAGEAADRSMGGMIKQLRNNWIAFKKEVADAGPFKAVKDILGAILEGVRTLLGSDEGQRAAQIIGKTIADLMYSAAEALLTAARDVAQLAATVREFLIRTGVVNGPEHAATGPELRAAPTGVERIVGSMIRGITATPRAVIQTLPTSARYLRNAAYGEGGAAEAAPSAAVAAIDAAIAALRVRRASAAASLPGGGGGGADGGDDGGGSSDAYVRKYRYAPGSAGPRTGGVESPMAIFMRYGSRQPSKAGEIADDEFAASQRQRRSEQVKALTTTLAGYWESYYRTTSAMADMALSSDSKRWKKVRQIAWMGMRSMLADFIEDQLKRAALKRLETIADMLAASGQPWSWAKAASSAAAALAYGALGATAGSVLRGGAGDMPSVEEGAGGGSGEYGHDSGRAISRSAGVKAQSVTYNLYVIHNAAAVYGSTSGIRELFESQFLPLLREYQGAYA